MILKAVYGNYRVHMDQVLQETGYIPEGEKLANRHAANIFFGNYMEPDADPKVYDQVSAFGGLKKSCFSVACRAVSAMQCNTIFGHRPNL